MAGIEPRLAATVLDAPDARELAVFYHRLLGWDVVHDEPDWVMLRPPDGGTGLSFQTEPLYRRPEWPSTTDRQQISAHLDIRVNDVDAAVAHATELGAQLAWFQPQEHVRVLLDPAGHAFCLFTD